MDTRMEELAQNHEIAITRFEDLEDNMQVVQNNVNVAKIQLSSAEREIRLLDSLMDNTHKQLEDLGNQVDEFVGSLCCQRANTLWDTRAVGIEFESFQKETSSQIESWSGRFECNNDIIDKKFVQLDMELEKVADLAGAKIRTEVTVIATDFAKAMELEEAQWLSSEAKIVALEEKLECACVLSRWPCHPTLFLLPDFNTPNSITILTFPFPKHSHEITQQEDEHKHDDNDYNNKLATLVPTVYSHPDPL
jgi:hypothetical protein